MDQGRLRKSLENRFGDGIRPSLVGMARAGSSGPFANGLGKGVGYFLVTKPNRMKQKSLSMLILRFHIHDFTQFRLDTYKVASRLQCESDQRRRLWPTARLRRLKQVVISLKTNCYPQNDRSRPLSTSSRCCGLSDPTQETGCCCYHPSTESIERNLASVEIRSLPSTHLVRLPG